MTVTSDRDLKDFNDAESNGHLQPAEANGHLSTVEVDDPEFSADIDSAAVTTDALEGDPIEPEVVSAAPKPHSGWAPMRWFSNLPIGRKQLLGLFTAELISIGGIVGVGAWLIVDGGHAQLENQAKSELAVTQINYDNQAAQMSSGFRGQADNAAIISAAKTYAKSSTLPDNLQKQVEKVLENETASRFIEYATLVDSNMRIVASPNAKRQGEVFDPNRLVSKALATSVNR